MNITQVKVFPVNEEKLKAYVSIVLDECFLVSDLKVIHGPNGLFISMPSKRKKNGEFKDIAHPLNRETRERMERRILEEYVRSAQRASRDVAISGSGSTIALHGVTSEAFRALAERHPDARLLRCRTLSRREYRERIEPTPGVRP